MRSAVQSDASALTQDVLRQAGQAISQLFTTQCNEHLSLLLNLQAEHQKCLAELKILKEDNRRLIDTRNNTIIPTSEAEQLADLRVAYEDVCAKLAKRDEEAAAFRNWWNRKQLKNKPTAKQPEQDQSILSAKKKPIPEDVGLDTNSVAEQKEKENSPQSSVTQPSSQLSILESPSSIPSSSKILQERSVTKTSSIGFAPSSPITVKQIKTSTQIAKDYNDAADRMRVAMESPRRERITRGPGGEPRSVPHQRRKLFCLSEDDPVSPISLPASSKRLKPTVTLPAVMQLDKMDVEQRNVYRKMMREKQKEELLKDSIKYKVKGKYT